MTGPAPNGPIPDDPIVGAAQVHELLGGWRGVLSNEQAEEPVRTAP